MSFSSETKKELCKNTPKLNEFMRAETYGLLLFCKHFNDSEISFTTEREIQLLVLRILLPHKQAR